VTGEEIQPRGENTRIDTIHILKIGGQRMKRSVLSGLSLAAIVLSLGLAGCGGAGVDEGIPAGDLNKPGVPLNTVSTDMTGRSFDSQAKEKKKAEEAAKGAEAAAPAEEKKK